LWLVYDSGACFEPSILDIKPADLRAKFLQGIQRLAAFSLGINYPNQASAPHLILGGFKRLLALAADTDVEFEQAKTVSLNRYYLRINGYMMNLTIQFCYW
jgi:large subunit ribosomal protein LP0